MTESVAVRSAAAGVVVVAAGAGRRFSAPGQPAKQFAPLRGLPILLWSIRTFLDHPRIGTIVVVLPEAQQANPPEWLAHLPVARVAGGAQRADSVRRGLAALPAGVERVLIHDGARPLVTRDLIDRVLGAAGEGEGEDAIVPGVRVTDTLKEAADDGRVLRTVPRDRLWRVQTPQSFDLAAVRDLHERAAREGITPSDDAGLFERYGRPVRIVLGDPINLKVTTPEDLAIAEVLAHGLPHPT